jgi:hypothetical protein
MSVVRPIFSWEPIVDTMIAGMMMVAALIHISGFISAHRSRYRHRKLISPACSSVTIMVVLCRELSERVQVFTSLQ